MIALLLAAAIPASPEAYVKSLEILPTDSAAEVVRKEMATYDLCILYFARQYALKSKEPAATIVDSAFGACAAHEASYRSAMINLIPSIRQSTLDELMASYQEKRRKIALSAIMDLRTAPPKKARIPRPAAKPDVAPRM